MSMEHLYTPVLEPVRHFSEPRLPIGPKRFVSAPKFISKPRLSSFAQFMEDFKLPKRYDLSKINTLTNWREDLYRSTFRHGDFSRHMTRSFLDTCDNKSFNEAMIQVQAANDRLLINGHSAAMSDDEIKDLASAKSRAFKKQILSLPEPEQFGKACELLASLGLSFRDELIKEKGKKGELFSLVNRVCDEIFLRRQLRKKYAYIVEQVARDLSLVQRAKQVYCSDFSVIRQRERNTSNQIALENTVAYDPNDLENWFTIAELAEKSVSNKEIRRGEMFTRLRGFEEMAQEFGHSAAFYTSTSPSRFHPISNGVVNKKWLDANRPTARNAHDYLMKVWQDLGRVLARKQIKVYGMRIAEPHQDGTPHHHYLLFMLPEHRDIVTAEFERLAFRDSPNEKGAQKHRFTSEYIDPSKGSAVGYVAKYISKSIDGKHIDSDRDSSLSGIDAAERVVTWARVNGIKQFQFIGGPSVSVWREMRRLREEFKEGDIVLSDLSETEHFMLEKIRKAADVGDWKDFCAAMGGVFVKRKDQPVKLQYNAPDAIERLLASGEFSPTRFGDTAQGRVSGLMFKQVFLCTRFRSWQTENKEKFLAAQKRIMSGVVDFYDALEAEKEYERMCDKRFQEYEEVCAYYEELEALILLGDIEGAYLVGAAPPDMLH
ncbi:replication endonuclease [Vibrio ordalii]|uniref:replication endonuclease n=2 Tax=Vibrio TaxID=662 RepID=UPI0025790F1F|nr:replication endonuclease [Vibrio ordalii]MCS0351125.1 replication endonuclease [Vibrio ordalii]